MIKPLAPPEVKNDSYYMLDYGQGFDPLLGVKITPVFFSVFPDNSKKSFSVPAFLLF